MSQFEEENALDGQRGGEVDEEKMREAWRNAEKLNDEPIPDEFGAGEEDDA